MSSAKALSGDAFIFITVVADAITAANDSFAFARKIPLGGYSSGLVTSKLKVGPRVVLIRFEEVALIAAGITTDDLINAQRIERCLYRILTAGNAAPRG